MSASENETFLQAILDAANVDMDTANTIDTDAVNVVDMDVANTIDTDAANIIDMDVANTSDTNACISRTSVSDAKGDQLEWEDVHDSTVIRGEFALYPIDIICQLECPC